MWSDLGSAPGDAYLQRLLRMEEELSRRVAGQDDAVRRVSKAVRKAAAGLKDPKRPIATFVFLGPGGASKLQLARALAGFLYGDEGALVGLDLSRYAGERARTDFLEALDQAVRPRPASVIVFDNIERADGGVLGVYFVMRDEGVIRGGPGPALDIRSSVVVACSNVGLERMPPPAAPCGAEELRQGLIAVGAEIDRVFPLGFSYHCDFVFFRAGPGAA